MRKPASVDCIVFFGTHPSRIRILVHTFSGAVNRRTLDSLLLTLIIVSFAVCSNAFQAPSSSHPTRSSWTSRCTYSKRKSSRGSGIFPESPRGGTPACKAARGGPRCTSGFRVRFRVSGFRFRASGHPSCPTVGYTGQVLYQDRT